MKKRFEDTYLTHEQVQVLRMRSAGMTISEIAAKLNVSRADIHAVLRNAYLTIERARKTLKLYSTIMGGIILTFKKGTPLKEIVNEVFKASDEYGIKINMRSVEILLKIIREFPECIEIKEEISLCDLQINVNSDGNIVVVKL